MFVVPDATMNALEDGPEFQDAQMKMSDTITKTESSREGHTHTIHHKPFTVLSAMAIGHGTTNTAVGVILVVASTVPFGGAPLAFWGFLSMAFVGLCVAWSLAELSSAMPHPGGQYVWTARLAPPKLQRSLAFHVGMLSWLGAVLTSASACLGTIEGIFAIVRLLRPEFEEKKWMVFLAYQALNILILFPATFEQALGKTANSFLVFTILGIFVTFVTLFARSEQQISASDFFTSLYNVSGWNKGVAFMIGLNGLNWTFSCLDVVVHITEEIPNPRVNVPRSLVMTIWVAVISGMLMITSIYINVPDFSVLSDTSAIGIYHYILRRNDAAAVILYIVPMISSAAAVWAIHTWQSRLAWTIARQNGMPFSSHLSRVTPAPFGTPIYAMIFSATVTAALGCIHLGSSTAFSSFIAVGTLCQYFSYSVPIVLLLRFGRKDFAHGPFWQGRAGLLANWVVLIWTVVSLIFYCFPYYLPVEVTEMNYCAVVLVGLITLIGALWVFHARKHYRLDSIDDYKML